MPSDFPLWRLSPEDAARIIIREPLKPVERHKFWRKREMRIRPSKRSEPRRDDLDRLNLAKPNHRGNLNSYWRQAFLEHSEEFPIVLLIGPMMRDGRFYTYTSDRVANPLGFERDKGPWLGLYSRAQYESDMAYWEEARALLRENYILGQQGEGPYIDGLLFLKGDNLLLAEQARCKARLAGTRAIMEQRRLAKELARPKVEDDQKWLQVKDEAVAIQFKRSGYTVQYLGIHNYRVAI